MAEAWAELNENDDGSVNHTLCPEREEEGPEINQRVRERLSGVGRYHPPERSVETGVHERAGHGVAGEGEGEEVGHHVPRLAVQSVQVDYDGVHYEEREAGEETEAEEHNVGGGRGAEEEGEEVHPGSDGRSVRDEEEDNGREHLRV